MNKWLSITFVLLLVGCGNDEKPKQDPEWNTEKSIEMNKDFAEEQDMDIKMYLSRFEGKEIIETGSGLRYMPIVKTEGEQAKVGQDAKVEYKISLLDGKVVYQTPTDELDIFKVDNSQVESGIHEGIKRMRVGEKAKLIFPSHLAHGLVGDLKDIPPLSPLVVDIELIELQ